MRNRFLTFWLSLGLAAVAMAAAIVAPAEVMDNLDFFSDFEMLSNLEILENEPQEDLNVPVSTAPAVSTSAFVSVISTETVKVSTSTGRSYEKP